MTLILPIKEVDRAPKFNCRQCHRDKPLDQIAVVHENNHPRSLGKSYTCKTCDANAKVCATTDKYVTQTGQKLSKTHKKVLQEGAKKRYKSGKGLPKWMFS